MFATRFALGGLFLASAMLLACPPGTNVLRDASSGEIGCPPAGIEIADDSGGYGSTRTWTARCNGKTFYCSGGAGSMKASCKEAQK